MVHYAGAQLGSPLFMELSHDERCICYVFYVFNGAPSRQAAVSSRGYFRWRWESSRDRVPPRSLIDNPGMSLAELYDLIRAGGENLRRNYCTR